MFVDPLAEETMTPYQYVNNNPVNLIDPTGMEAEDPTDPPKKEKSRGDKVLHFKQDGKDMSVYENDKGIIAGAYRFGKSVREWSDEFLSGGFQFDDDDNKSKGDLSLRRQSRSGQDVKRLNISGVMQLGSFAKSADGTNFKYNDAPIDQEKAAKITNSILTGFGTGQNIGERELKINVLPYQYQNKKNEKGGIETVRIHSVTKDSAVKVKDLIQVRLKANKKSINNYYDKQREGSFFQSK